MVKCRVSVTANEWYLKVYKDYMVVTGHWVDPDWNLRSIEIEFERFLTPHKNGAAETFLRDMRSDWYLLDKSQGVTMEKASDMVKRIDFLQQSLRRKCPSVYSEHHLFYVRCFAEVLNLTVKEALWSTHSKIKNIFNFVGTVRVRSLVNRKTLFEAMWKSMNVDYDCPTLDCETRWFSTFKMVHNGYNASFVFYGMEGRSELNGYNISKVEWEADAKVCQFLETAASAIKKQSETTYVTLRVIKNTHDKLLTKCENTIAVNSAVTNETAILMWDKFFAYESRVKTIGLLLARIMDSRWRTLRFYDST